MPKNIVSEAAAEIESAAQLHEDTQLGTQVPLLAEQANSIIDLAGAFTETHKRHSLMRLEGIFQPLRGTKLMDETTRDREHFLLSSA